jgi:hypothetical protein
MGCRNSSTGGAALSTGAGAKRGFSSAAPGIEVDSGPRIMSRPEDGILGKNSMVLSQKLLQILGHLLGGLVPSIAPLCHGPVDDSLKLGDLVSVRQ